MSKLSKNSKRILGAAAACLMLAGWSASSQAQTCIVTNWLGGQINLANENAGTQGNDNRRYAGPCGLRVPVDGIPRYVIDNSPAGVPAYIARFYAFLDNAGTTPIILFEANDGTDAQIQVWYNVPDSKDLTLRVFDAGSSANDATFSNVGTGWHSIEFAWESAAAAQVAFSVNGASDIVINPAPDTSGISIANALLGNVGGAGSGGDTTAIDFDDFDSRRTTRPGRLCRGDIDGDNQIRATDVLTAWEEASTFGAVKVDGQPDYDGDGAVRTADVLAMWNNHARVFNFNCPD